MNSKSGYFSRRDVEINVSTLRSVSVTRSTADTADQPMIKMMIRARGSYGTFRTDHSQLILLPAALVVGCAEVIISAALRAMETMKS
jgi:hypothetical protein